jgi:glycosyltransferase involved in cell wall biosynthesis
VIARAQPATARLRRVLYCTTNRYRTYNRQNYETLADAFELRVVWVSPPPAAEPLPEELAARIQTWVVDDDPRRLTMRDVRRSSALFRIVERQCRDCDLVIAPPAGSWKTRLLYAAARMHGVPVAMRSDTWREGDGLLRGGRRDEPREGLGTRVQRRLTSFLERHADGLLVNGSKGADYLVGRGISPDRVFTFRRLHPDLASAPLDRELVQHLRALKGSRTAFLYLGRVMQQKGLVPLIRAFRALLATGRDAVLFVVGGPIVEDTGRGRVSVDYFEESKQLAGADPRIVFTGQIAPTTVHNYYAVADVFVHPHVARFGGQDVHEPWGNVITEAASMRMPIVVTDRIPAGFDLVEHGVNGYLLDADRVEAQLGAALIPFIDTPELIQKFGAHSRSHYEAYADPAGNIDTVNRVIDSYRRRRA